MGEKGNRYHAQVSGAAIYWRRRAIALAVVMAVLMLLAWAVNGTLGSSAASQASMTSTTGHPGGGAGAGTGRGAAGGAGSTSGEGAATAGGRAGSGVAGRRAGHAHGSGGNIARGRARGGQGTARGAGGGAGGRQAGQHQAAGAAGQSGHAGIGTCPAGAVVLSLRQPRSSYGRGARPRFTAEIVSTDPRPCAFNVGSRFVSLVIRLGRRSRWNSATCPAGPASRDVTLARGVPELLSFEWNRTLTAPGCRRPGRPVKPGTYRATAVSGTLTSNTLAFTLTR